MLDAQRDAIAAHDADEKESKQTALENQVGAAEQLYEAYTNYVTLAEDETAHPEDVAEALEAVAIAEQALEETLAEDSTATAQERWEAEQALNEANDALAQAEAEAQEAEENNEAAQTALTEVKEALQDAQNAKAGTEQRLTEAQAAREAAEALYDGSLEGETLYVLLCVADELIVVPAVVEDGCLHFMLTHLGMDEPDWSYTQFVIVDEACYSSITA